MLAVNEQGMKVLSTRYRHSFTAWQFVRVNSCRKWLLWAISTPARPKDVESRVSPSHYQGICVGPPYLQEFIRRIYHQIIPHIRILDGRAIAFRFLLLMVLGLPASAIAQDARLKNITIATADQSLVVSLNVEHAFSPTIMKILLEGDPVNFTFYISLYRRVNLWFDETLAEHKLVHTVQYESQRKLFTISRPWLRDKPVVTQSLTEAQALMTQVVDFQIFSLNELRKGTLYELRAKAELRPVMLPYNLRYIFYFVSLWDIETDWHTVDFEY